MCLCACCLWLHIYMHLWLAPRDHGKSSSLDIRRWIRGNAGVYKHSRPLLLLCSPVSVRLFTQRGAERSLNMAPALIPRMPQRFSCCHTCHISSERRRTPERITACPRLACVTDIIVTMFAASQPSSQQQHLNVKLRGPTLVTSATSGARRPQLTH